MPIHRTIIYDSSSQGPDCQDCTASPSLSVDLVYDRGDLKVKKNNEEIREIEIIWSDGASGPFSIVGSYTAAGSARVKDTLFQYTGTGSNVQPTGGGMTWSRDDNQSTLTFVFHPLAGGESEGMWIFNPLDEPPIKLKVIVKRKTGSYSCPP